MVASTKQYPKTATKVSMPAPMAPLCHPELMYSCRPSRDFGGKIRGKHGRPGTGRFYNAVRLLIIHFFFLLFM